MALQTSGAISFSQIVAEFGGAGSHSLSEYYPLVGQGVSGLPSSGTFSFSHFHGKSKNITISVWTTSGYNQSVQVQLGGLAYSPTYYSWGFMSNNHGWSSGIRIAGTDHWGTNTYTVGGITYTGGGGYGSAIHSRIQTQQQWVDTSAYVNTASIASIST